jgi:hypothetical protein
MFNFDCHRIFTRIGFGWHFYVSITEHLIRVLIENIIQKLETSLF